MKVVQFRKAQGGLAVITLVIATVILIAVLMGMVAASRTTSSTGDQTARLLAGAVIDQGNLQRVGIDLMVAAGSDISTIAYGTHSTALENNGLFNPTTGGTVWQVPPGDALGMNALGRWLYSSPTTHLNPLLPNAANGALTDTTTKASYAVVLTGVKDSACRMINNILRNYAADSSSPIPEWNGAKPQPQATSGALASYVGGTTELNFKGNRIMNLGALVDKNTNEAFDPPLDTFEGYAGCVRPTGSAADDNVYFNIVKPL